MGFQRVKPRKRENITGNTMNTIMPRKFGRIKRYPARSSCLCKRFNRRFGRLDNTPLAKKPSLKRKQGQNNPSPLNN
jgi:hypothetical protein